MVSAQGAPLDFKSAVSMRNGTSVATLTSWGKRRCHFMKRLSYDLGLGEFVVSCCSYGDGM